MTSRRPPHSAQAVSEDAPDWFRVTGSGVVPRPPSPTTAIINGPPRGKATCTTESHIFDSSVPSAVESGHGKFGKAELMLEDTITKEFVRASDPSSMNFRHREVMSKNPKAFVKIAGSMQTYLEQAVRNRHILPVQRSHQRLTPLTEFLPKALAASHSSDVIDFQRLYTGLSRAATAKGDLRGSTSSSTLTRAQMQEAAEGLMQTRAISRMSPRLSKEMVSGHSNRDTFNNTQSRPHTVATMGGGRSTMGSRASTSNNLQASPIGGAFWDEEPTAESEEVTLAAQSMLSSVGLTHIPEAPRLPSPHIRTQSRMNLSLTHQSIETTSSTRPGSSVTRRQRRPPSVNAQLGETIECIDSFELKQGLHGAGYMTKKELRDKLKRADGLNLGVSIDNATKAELVAAYNQYAAIRKEPQFAPLRQAAEKKAQEADALSKSQQLAASSRPNTSSSMQRGDRPASVPAPVLDSPTTPRESSPAPQVDATEPTPAGPATAAVQAPGAAPRNKGKPLTFNVRNDQDGPVKQLTPRSCTRVVSYFDQPTAQQLQQQQ